MNAHTFALIFGIAYLGAGMLGLVPPALLPPPADAPATRFDVLYGYLFGLFPVNVLHSGVHLAIGLWGLAAWSGAANPLTYARALAVVYGVLAVMGLIPGLNTVFGLIPIHGHDVWLHAATAAVAAYVGFFQKATTHDERRRAMGDRRQSLRPVAIDRRIGMHDRRQPSGYGRTPHAA
jgi:hypothetical protein